MLCRCCGAICNLEFVSEGHMFCNCIQCGSIQTPSLKKRSIVNENEASRERNTADLCRERARRISEFCPDAGSVIDYGCGNGELVRYLRQQFRTAVGIDKGTRPMLIEISENSIDAFIMVEVIEHLQEPKATLAAMANRLRTGGIIYIETGTVDAVDDASTCGYCKPSIGHCSMFSIAGLRRLASAINFEFTEINSTCFVFKKS